MGGRRGKIIREVFGSGNRQIKTELTSAIKEKNVKQMSLSSFNLFFESENTRKTFSKAVKLMSIVAKESVKKGDIDKRESEKIASKIWTEIKSKEKIETPTELDKIFVSSASNVLRRRRK